MNLIPDRGTSNETEDKLIVDGANGVGGEKLEVIKEKLNELDIEVRNSGKEGGVLNEGVGADFVQKEKVVPHGFGSNHAGISFSGVQVWMEMLIDLSIFLCHQITAARLILLMATRYYLYSLYSSRSS